MPIAVCNGAMLQCTMGTVPTPLGVLTNDRILVRNRPMASIMDNKPGVNIVPFGMCKSLANPSVASATAAAMGVLTPMPCSPVIAAPWAPGDFDSLVAGEPALTNSSKCMCNWAGTISIMNPGCTKVQC